MKYNKTVLSAVTMALLMTGCVKPTEEVNTTATNTDTTSTDTTVVYDDQPTVIYEDSAPITYEDPATTISSGVTYDTTVTATDHYQPTAGGTTTGGTTTGGAYGDIYSGGSGGDIYTETTPYVSEDPYTTDNTYTGGYSTSTTTPVGNGIHLQVAALKDYYAAEEFRKGLSLDPKYGSYVKRGAMNKVIVTGIPSRSEAKRLADRQFPGAFIVGGSAISSYSGGSSTSYTSPVSSSPSHNNNGIGVQIGAFSSKSAARNAAQSAAGGQYTAIVKTAKVRGRTMYKAILVGFASRRDAKNAIASGQFGDAFVVSNAYQ